jgi:hypothetical protein
LGDWVKLSSTAGKIDPNGTTGSTTKPSTGFSGIIRDVGTAGGGAGLALIEVFNWNAASGAGGKQQYLGAGAPGINEDDVAGYEVGSLGFDTDFNNPYWCSDNSTGAAIWQAF